MLGVTQHTMLATSNHDEQVREDFVRHLSVVLETKLRPGIRRVYDCRVAPNLAERYGRDPTRREIISAMRDHPLNQFWYGVRTHNQERMFDIAGDMVERQLPILMSTARQLSGACGSLTLDAGIKNPTYLNAFDVHRQPGGYHTELCTNDVAAGAQFDRAISIHAMGSQGPLSDDGGMSVAAWVRAEHPEFHPRRILDLGCTVGHFTLPFKHTFPDAEVHGIDVAAHCLRYAHARACALATDIHFRQMNAEALSFEDGAFDLIVSRQLLHETSRPALAAIFKECNRVLSTAGIMLHQDAPQFEELDPYTASLRDWDITCNNEPFMATCYDLPLEQMFAEAGFAPDKTFRAYAPSLYFQRHNIDRHATRNAGGRYFFAGAAK